MEGAGLGCEEKQVTLGLGVKRFFFFSFSL